MNEVATSAPAPTPTSKLVSVGSITVILSIIGNVAWAAVNYGRQDSDLRAYKDQIVQYQKALETRDENLKKWMDAYEQRGTKLAELQSQVRQLEDDRCAPLQESIAALKISIENPYSATYDQTIDAMRSMMQQYQETLRACYSARTT